MLDKPRISHRSLSLAPASALPDAVPAKYVERSRAVFEMLDVSSNQMRLALLKENAKDDWSHLDDSTVRAQLHSTMPH